LTYSPYSKYRESPRAGSDKYYAGTILRPHFKSTEEESQATQFIGDYRKILKKNEDISIDYYES